MTTITKQVTKAIFDMILAAILRAIVIGYAKRLILLRK